jgi:two-component system CheB/CheR fusion protein
VVNRELQIQVWNDKAENLWGLREEEVVGQYFLNLDIGLPVEKLQQPIRNCLAGESESQYVVLNATNRRGRAIQCKVTCIPLVGMSKEIRGAIVLMENLGDEGATQEIQGL